MRFLLPSVPYPLVQPEQGYWAPVTSTINWCEEDYYATPYIAEIVNSLTNLLFLYLGMKGLRNCLKNDHDRVFVVAFIGYLLVGSGSLAFHGTLKYPMQLVDELSMIYTACLMCYATFSFSRSKLFCQILGVSQTSLAVFVTLYYHYLQDPRFHQNCFAILATLTLVRSIYIMETNLRPSLRIDKTNNLQKRNQRNRNSDVKHAKSDKRDLEILKEMWLMVIFGLSIFLGGFALWNLDNIYCSKIRRWRHDVGLPWGILLEGHGWWHLMTGLGSYFHIVWNIWLRYCISGKQNTYRLSWPSICSIPEVIYVDKLE